MREQVREQLILRGDHDTYKTAKSASDGLEHGELDEVAAYALKSTDRTFLYFRTREQRTKPPLFKRSVPTQLTLVH
jgi:hypothetical protein